MADNIKQMTEEELFDKRINIALGIHYSKNVNLDRVLKILCRKYNYSYTKVCERVNYLDLYYGI